MCKDQSGCVSWWGRDRESVRTVSEPGRKLGRQADGDGLHLAQDRRSQGVEERRPRGTPLAKGMHSCGVVAKDNHCADLGEVTGTGKSPNWTASSFPGVDRQHCLTGVPTGPKRPDSRDGRPNPRPRASDQKWRTGDAWCRDHAEREDEGDGATTGDREDTPSTLRLKPPDPDGPRNHGRAGGDYSPR